MKEMCGKFCLKKLYFVARTRGLRTENCFTWIRTFRIQIFEKFGLLISHQTQNILSLKDIDEENLKKKCDHQLYLYLFNVHNRFVKTAPRKWADIKGCSTYSIPHTRMPFPTTCRLIFSHNRIFRESEMWNPECWICAWISNIRAPLGRRYVCAFFAQPEISAFVFF